VCLRRLNDRYVKIHLKS